MKIVLENSIYTNYYDKVPKIIPKNLLTILVLTKSTTCFQKVG